MTLVLTASNVSIQHLDTNVWISMNVNFKCPHVKRDLNALTRRELIRVKILMNVFLIFAIVRVADNFFSLQKIDL